MSRSFHETKARLRRELRWRYSDPEVAHERREHLEGRLRTKRAVKDCIREERARAADGIAPAPLDPDTLPIRTVDQGPGIHYPATEADLRAVLRALPPGSGDGLTGIELLLGEDEQLATARDHAFDEGTRDPRGRVAEEGFPGAFGPLCLGNYSPRHARICLHAWVTAPGGDLGPFEIVLKLRALGTLAHEVAHHVDHRTRFARGRWRSDETRKLEDYAEQRQREWSREVVVPYLEREHPEAVAAWTAWTIEHAGTAIPLAALEENGLASMFGLWGSIEAFAHAVHRGEPLDVARVELARELHYCERYGLAHRILGVVLAAEPEHQAALLLRADIRIHEGRLDEADAILRGCLTRDERDPEVWVQFLDLEVERRDWPRVAEVTTRGLELVEPGDHEARRFLGGRARAWLELGEHERLAADVAVLREEGAPFDRLTALGLQAIALLRSGRLAEALETAEAGLAEVGRTRTTWRHEFLAVRFDATRRLDPGATPEPLSKQTLAALRHRGYEDWAAVLETP